MTNYRKIISVSISEDLFNFIDNEANINNVGRSGIVEFFLNESPKVKNFLSNKEDYKKIISEEAMTNHTKSKKYYRHYVVNKSNNGKLSILGIDIANGISKKVDGALTEKEADYKIKQLKNKSAVFYSAFDKLSRAYLGAKAELSTAYKSSGVDVDDLLQEALTYFRKTMDERKSILNEQLPTSKT